MTKKKARDEGGASREPNHRNPSKEDQMADAIHTLKPAIAASKTPRIKARINDCTMLDPLTVTDGAIAALERIHAIAALMTLEGADTINDDIKRAALDAIEFIAADAHHVLMEG